MKALRSAQSALKKAGIEADVLVLSFDTKHDTPQTLTTFKKHMRADLPHWTMAVGSEADTRALANLIGIKFATDLKTGEINHDNRIVLVSADGQILSELNGLNSKVSDFVKTAVNSLGLKSE